MYTHQSDSPRNITGGPRIQRGRRGTALVEFAISLPILFILIFGGIEIANAIFLQQFVSETSYQGALDAMQPNSLEAGRCCRDQ